MNRGALIFALATVNAAALAQTPAPALLARAFDVASVKPSAPGSQGIDISGFHPSQFTSRNAPLAVLLVFAYGLRSIEQVTGGPEWVRTEGFDIVTRSSEPYPLSEVPIKVRGLLAERFTLRAHIDTTDGAVYILKVVRRDGTLGPKLHPSTVDCAALLAAGQTLPQPVAGERAPCTARQSLSGRDRTLWTNAMPMAQLADMLAVAAERDVIDQTGLAGGFDAELAWTHDAPARNREAPLPMTEGVSLFTAVMEQLGLRLEPGRGPVKVLVIDSVERPTPD